VAPCGKKTTSGRMFGCVIFFPRLAHIVNQGVIRRAEPRKILVLDPMLGWVNLPMVLCMIFTHGFGHDGFRSMDAMIFGPWYWML